MPTSRSYAWRARRSSSRPRRAAGPGASSCMRPVFIDHSMRGVLKAASPMMTGASLAPSPCCRQRCQSGVFCCSRSILGMGSVLLAALLGGFAVEQLERAAVRALGHLAQRGAPVIGKYPLELGRGFVDELLQLAHLFRRDDALRAERGPRICAFVLGI